MGAGGRALTATRLVAQASVLARGDGVGARRVAGAASSEVCAKPRLWPPPAIARLESHIGFTDPPVWVSDVRYLGGYRVWLRFNDGLEGDIDLWPELRGEMFEPLRGAALFEQVRLHPDCDTIVWPNGADLAPEFLYEQVKRAVSDGA